MSNDDMFQKSDYVVIKNLIDANEARKLYEYTLENINIGNMKDDQAPGSPSFYQDKKMTALHKTLLHKVEDLVKLKLTPTFCYYRTYRTGAILKMHRDRKSCEIAISLNIGQQGDCWDLWLLDHDENACNITLSPGDALIYRGCKLLHWRGKLVHADYVSQAFFFFVNQKGWTGFTISKYEYLRKFLKRCRLLLGITSY